MAVYLRFQLPPLHLANVESVDVEMNHLLGIKGAKAKAIIQELDVQSMLPAASYSYFDTYHSLRMQCGRTRNVVL